MFGVIIAVNIYIMMNLHKPREVSPVGPRPVKLDQPKRGRCCDGKSAFQATLLNRRKNERSAQQTHQVGGKRRAVLKCPGWRFFFVDTPPHESYWDVWLTQPKLGPNEAQVGPESAPSVVSPNCTKVRPNLAQKGLHWAQIGAC